MTTKHALFHPQTVRALLDLSNPRKSVALPLEKGRAAGKLDLIYQLFPPHGVHRNTIPATYTCMFPGSSTFELALMVSMVDVGDGGDGLAFGFISHDLAREVAKESKMQLRPQHLFAAVRYNPNSREGSAYFYKPFYGALIAILAR